MTGENKKAPQRVNLFLDPAIVRKAKHQALKEGISLSKLVDKALDEYVPNIITIYNKGEEMDIEFVEDEKSHKKK